MSFKPFLLGALAITVITIVLFTLAPQTDLPNPEINEYLAYIAKYKKTLSSPKEMSFRLQVYLDNKRYIEQQNELKLGFTLGENEFTDLTFEEFSGKYLLQNPKEQNLERPTANKNYKLRGSKDWDKEGKVTPVKNQGACGSCWAFSSTGSLETAHAIKGAHLIGYSESELVDCSQAYGNAGCNGGEMADAFKYIVDHKLAPESDYPYQPSTSRCKADTKKDNRIVITGYQILENPVVEDLVKMIDVCSVSIGIEARRDFQSYKNGIYKSNSSCGQRLNHGVLAVGYGNDSASGDDYFLIKNSWGNTWGEKGYVRVLVGTGAGTCGVASRDDVYPILA